MAAIFGSPRSPLQGLQELLNNNERKINQLQEALEEKTRAYNELSEENESLQLGRNALLEMGRSEQGMPSHPNNSSFELILAAELYDDYLTQLLEEATNGRRLERRYSRLVHALEASLSFLQSLRGSEWSLDVRILRNLTMLNNQADPETESIDTAANSPESDWSLTSRRWVDLLDEVCTVSGYPQSSPLICAL